MGTKLEAISKDEDFKSVLSVGQRFSSKNLRMSVKRVAESRIRLGIIIKKKFGNAVVRNRARRRIRSAIYETIEKARVKSGADIAIFLVITIKTEAFSEIKHEIGKLMGRAGIV